MHQTDDDDAADEAATLRAILAAMAAANIDGPTLAAKIGMGTRTLTRRLSGETPFSIPQLRRIRKALKLEWRELLPGDAA